MFAESDQAVGFAIILKQNDYQLFRPKDYSNSIYAINNLSNSLSPK